ncbi:MAG: glycosyltransferase family A protein [Ginsengibacter sp.]
MSNTYKISIVTCFYNVESFIEQTIKSVLQQQYTGWELLLIDDGSSDASTAIAKKYASKYEGKVFYFEHDGHANKGLSYSRNVAIKKATGEFITFLDADDIWLLQYLNHQVEVLTTHPECAMICEATEYWYSWSSPKEFDAIIKIGTAQDQLYSPPQLMLNLYPLGEGDAPCVCGIIIKKSVLEKYGGFDESFKGLYEDQVFLSKIYLQEKVFISSSCNNKYRQRPDSIIGASFENGNYYLIRKRFLQWLKKYIADNNIHFPEVDKKLEAAISYEPLVSTVICFYDEENFLEEAIKSVLKQSYTNWELLLVDDGSSDRSSQIAQQYAAEYAGKIYYCEHENHSNKGLSASRNHGIRKSKGSLVALLDADDVWLEEKLITQVSIFQRNPGIGIIGEGSLYWNTWNQTVRPNVHIPVGVEPELIYEPYELMYILYPLGIGAAPVPSGLMIKKDAFERSGYFEESFVKEYSLYEDQAFLSKMYLQEKVYISSACNHLYRQRPGSIVSWVREKGHYYNVRYYFLKWLQALIAGKNIKDKKLQRLLNKALFRYNYPNIFYLVHDLPRIIWKGSKKRVPDKTKQFIKQKLLKQKKQVFSN